MGNHLKQKILIVAPNASSRFGGEAFLPLKYFELLRQRGYPAKLITHSRNRQDLEKTLGPFRDDIFYIEDSAYHRVIWQIGTRFPKRIEEAVFGTLMNIVNDVFQARIIKRLIAQGGVDIIHQPIPVSPLAPSAIYGFGVPVVIGPMNGGMTYPQGYEDHESTASRMFVRVARAFARGLNRVIPGKRRADALLVANERTRRALPLHDHPNVISIVENGVDLAAWRPPSLRPPAAVSRTQFKLAFMGRLVDWKAVDITLDAIIRARQSGIEVTLDILGDGPERPHLERLASAPALIGAVRFHGFLLQAECADILLAADALILNSVRECGGAVVLEAMSLGLPVIGPDWGGPADYIDPSCGILVSPVPKADFGQRLADAIVILANDPELRRKMGQAGAQKVRDQFDWEKKINQIIGVYESVLVDRS